MLVLSRHRDESIIIGDDVVVTIVDIRGDKVRLGIQAPTDVPVHRQEVYEAIKRENEKAAHAAACGHLRNRGCPCAPDVGDADDSPRRSVTWGPFPCFQCTGSKPVSRSFLNPG